MITVKYIPQNYTLTINGHAGYAEEGKDIVCSAVSILFGTLCVNLLQMADDYLCSKPEITEEKGNCSVQCTPKEGAEEIVNSVFFTIVLGLDLLTSHYPDYVKFCYIDYSS